MTDIRPKVNELILSEKYASVVDAHALRLDTQEPYYQCLSYAKVRKLFIKFLSYNVNYSCY